VELLIPMKTQGNSLAEDEAPTQEERCGQAVQHHSLQPPRPAHGGILKRYITDNPEDEDGEVCLIDRHKYCQAEHTSQRNIGRGLPGQPVTIEWVGQGRSFEEGKGKTSPEGGNQCGGDGSAVVTGGPLPRFISGQFVQAEHQPE